MKYLLFFSLTFLYSCNEKDTRPSQELIILEQKDKIQFDQLPKKWIYSATLQPLNTQFGTTYGSLTIARDENEIAADVYFKGGTANTLHMQNIHIGNECPNDLADINSDGFIDAKEASKITKEILIPLDGDLKNQAEGSFYSPVSDEFGNYVYSHGAIYSDFILDLIDIDIDPLDNLIKLKSEKELDLTNKVFMIYGVAESTQLPSTVNGYDKHPNFQSLPIACGIIREVTSTPGVIIDNDEAPEMSGAAGGINGENDGAILNTENRPVEESSPDDYGNDDAH